MFFERGFEDGRYQPRPFRCAQAPEAPVVHMVDADAESRQRLADLLAATGLRLKVYGDLAEFLEADHRAEFGCLVVDAGQRHVGGGDLHSCGLSYPLVMTARRADVATAVQAMKAGAVDFVEKPFQGPAILEAIDAALDLHRQQRLTASRGAALRARYASLTPRERQVMALVTAGRMNKQVAGDLGLSEITVKAHRGAMMRKIGARSLAELVRMADALGAEAEGERGRSATVLRIASLSSVRTAAGVDRHSGCSPAA